MRHVRHDPADLSCQTQDRDPHSSPPTEGANPTAARLGTLLRQASEALERALAECARMSGVSEARFKILDALSDSYGSECTQADLAGRLQQSESHLSSQLERLADEGWLERERSPRDRRKTLVRTTPRGQTVWSRAAAIRAAVLQRLLRNWEPAELQQADNLLHALQRDLDSLPESLVSLLGRVHDAAAVLEPVTPRSSGQER